MGQVSTTIRVVDKGSKTLNNILNKINSVNKAFSKMASQSSNVNNALQSASSSNNKFTSSLNSSNSALKKNSNQVSLLTTKLRRLASAYLGVMGAKALITTSDNLTSANNKFTTFANQNGIADATSFSQETMDKIFNSAQASASGYMDTMSNVAKLITLSADAFGTSSEQQVDNAIKFNEIMAKTYALGGASAAEQASSMYQMVQALGSGVLQGDELRSVREGAPLAYKAIEEFAQGVLHSDESLKDLASQGVITSDIVVAAILGMEDETNAAFEEIDLTWGQLWTRFKNDSIKAFQPLLENLRKIANSDSFQFLVSKITDAMTTVAAILNMIVTGIGYVIDWMANNWTIVQGVINAVIAVLLVLALKALGTLIAQTTIAIAKWIILNWQFLLVLAAIALIVYYLSVVGVTAQSVGDVLVAVGLALMLLGLTIAPPFFIVLGIIILLAGAFLRFAGEIMGGLFVIGAFFKNVWFSILNIYMGVVNVMNAIWINFQVLFHNIVKDCQSAFYIFAANVIGKILDIATAINSLLGIFGIEIDTSGLKSAMAGLVDKAAEAQSEKLDYVDVGEAWKQGLSTYDTWQDGWASDAYSNGYDVGTGIQNGFNNWVNGIGNNLGGLLDGFSGITNPTAGAGVDMSGFDFGGVGDDVGSIAKDTGKISKDMDIAQEDLEYLKEIAEVGAINRFTTAKIVVKQNNENHISNDMDIDGVMRRFTDDIIEAVNIQAEGVHIS